MPTTPKTAMEALTRSQGIRSAAVPLRTHILTTTTSQDTRVTTQTTTTRQSTSTYAITATMW
jgi:hypothetical protein